MATEEGAPHAIIERFLSPGPDTLVDSSIALLQVLSNALIGVIGEEGFESLLFRSAHQAAQEFPWLRFDPRARPADPEFELLRQCLAGQDPAAAGAASMLLFKTFIDSLMMLIGEHLTMLILDSALGGASAGKTSKEHNNG